VEQDTMPYCVENNISILAYSSLAQGLLTGKFGLDHKFEEGDH
jgi:aryl-alcohol dehydrogenase-like predicted oxidoreductase